MEPQNAPAHASVLMMLLRGSVAAPLTRPLTHRHRDRRHRHHAASSYTFFVSEERKLLVDATSVGVSGIASAAAALSLELSGLDSRPCSCTGLYLAAVVPVPWLLRSQQFAVSH